MYNTVVCDWVLTSVCTTRYLPFSKYSNGSGEDGAEVGAETATIKLLMPVALHFVRPV